MKMLAILAMCVAAAMGQTVIIDGKSVSLSRVIVTKPLFVVTGVKIGLGKLVSTGEDCAIITGKLVSYLPTANYDVTVTIDVVQTRRGEFAQDSHMRTVVVKVERPEPQKAVTFMSLCQGLYPNCELRCNSAVEYKYRTGIPPQVKP